ncbi:MAG TPA: hypothetical protein VIX80_09415 [Candidatus Kapabacteria bacterium]
MRHCILRHLIALAFLASTSAISLAQHSLQLDNGSGFIGVLDAAGVPAGVTYYSLLSVWGMLITTGSAANTLWKLDGNLITSGMGISSKHSNCSLL